MKVAFVAYGAIPNPTSGGGALTQWTTARHLVARGHDVTAVCVVPESDLDPGASANERLAALEAEGVQVVALRGAATRPGRRGGRLRRMLSPRAESLYPTLADRGQVGDAVRRVRPDVAFVYHFEALAASVDVDVPRLAAVGDPTHLPMLYRWRLLGRKRLDRSSLREAVEVASAAWRLRRLMPRLLDDCASSGAFAAHHAAWLRSQGARRCVYLRTPVPDPPTRWVGGDGAPRLLHVGHLKGIATLEGLLLLQRDVLPRLDDAVGPEGFALDLVGGFDPPEQLRGLIAHPAVRLRGHLENPAQRFREASALVVPITIPLGVRVRILTAFSFGTPVVAHTVNARGTPELEDGRNALLAASGAQLADALVAALGDPQLRAGIGQGGRKTYERWFAPEPAAGRIESLLAEIAR